MPYAATCDNTPSFILLNLFSAPMFAAYNSPAARAHDIVKSVVGHEFMHVLQFAMARSTSCDDMRWFDEATAEWVMDSSPPSSAPTSWCARHRGRRRQGRRQEPERRLSRQLSLQRPPALARKGVADDSFGYADYLFFQFLARKYTPATIKSIYDQMAAPAGASTIDAISLTIDAKTAWPSLGLALGTTSRPRPRLLEKEDDYDFGLYDVFHNAGRLRGAPTNLKPLDIDQKGKPDALFTLLDNALLASKSGDTRSRRAA